MTSADGASASSERLRAWLASGDLQAPDGAICAWLDADSGELAFAYPEITGYALTWLAGRAEPTDAEVALGRSAAAWLVQRMGPTGDRDLSARAGWDNGAIYTFDLGMIAAGLLSFGARFGVHDTQELGRAIASRLAGYVRDDGVLPAVAPDGPASGRGSSWSTEGVPHNVKCVQALLLAEESDAARAMLDAVDTYQREDGRFVTQPVDDRVMLHPHLYTVEGLWMAGTALGDDTLLERARRGARWAWQHQLPSGGLPRHVAVEPDVQDAPEQLDVTSQALRANVLFELDADGASRAAQRLAGVAEAVGEGAALPYQPAAPARHRNAWVTMFGAQALEIVGGPEAMAWSQLV